MVAGIDEPIVIDRLSAVLRHGHAIYAEGGRCGRQVYLNLPAVIALDGDRGLLDLRVRCSGCGQRATTQLHSIETMKVGWVGSRVSTRMALQVSGPDATDRALARLR